VDSIKILLIRSSSGHLDLRFIDEILKLLSNVTYLLAASLKNLLSTMNMALCSVKIIYSEHHLAVMIAIYNIYAFMYLLHHIAKLVKQQEKDPGTASNAMHGKKKFAIHFQHSCHRFPARNP
jgi:hypothetical protein